MWAGAMVAVTAMVVGYATVEKTAPLGANAAEPDLGKVDNFRLADQNFESHELSQLKGASAIVLFTQANGCPVVRNSVSTLKALRDQYAAKGVEFMMLDSSLIDSRDDIAAEAKDYGYDFPILRDANQLVGEQLKVTRSGEAIIINPKTWRIIYRGPLDDRVTYERQKASADQTWAKDALEALLAGKPAPVAQVEPVGCLVDFPARDKRETFTKISYTSTVAPIIQEKCASCHQPGGIGPMPLTNYQQIRAFAPMIREVIRTQRMPPFHADPSVGHFLDDKSLSPDQIRTLVHWVEAGAPRGDGPDPLAAIKFQAPEWPLGKPDLVLNVPAFTIPANGVVDYQRPFVPNTMTDGHWLRASTIKVGQRQGVHHILTGYVDQAPAPGQTVSETQWGVSIGGYAVGSESTIQPKNVGVWLPPGGGIGFQNHYTPFGKEAVDASQVALYFYPKGETPAMVMHNVAIANPNIEIPAGDGHHEEVAYLTFPKEALLYSAFPHAHYRAASAKVSIRYPDGTEKLLLALPKYDFNWQREYVFATPLKVPAGSKIITHYIYDNSSRNPANPDPKSMIHWGEQSFQEMQYTALRYRWMDETSAHQKPENDKLLAQGRMMGFLDAKIDGKLTMAELHGPIGEKLKANFALIDTNHDGSIDATELAAVQNMMGGRKQAAPTQANAAMPAGGSGAKASQ